MTENRNKREWLRAVAKGKWRGAMTIVELLVTIAVIGVITAIAVPSFVDVIDESKDSTARRNAQSIALVASVAIGAGNETLLAAPNLDSALDVLFGGVSGKFAFATAQYEISEMSDDDLEAAKQFLRFQGGVIIYSP